MVALWWPGAGVRSACSRIQNDSDETVCGRIWDERAIAGRTVGGAHESRLPGCWFWRYMVAARRLVALCHAS